MSSFLVWDGGGQKGGRLDPSKGESNANIGFLEICDSEISDRTQTDDRNENGGYVFLAMDVYIRKCTRNKRKVDEEYSPSISTNTNKRVNKNKITSDDKLNKETTDDSDVLSDNIEQRYKKIFELNGQTAEAKVLLNKAPLTL